VFLPNQYWLHKNHRLVIDALHVLRRQGRPAPLVISTGKTQDLRDPTAFDSFRAALAEYGVAEDYWVLGVIDRQHMLVLMSHSMAVLNPSRFEGWSTTVEEAKALGKTLLVSDIAVHREQVQGRRDAKLFGTDDAPALAEHLAQLQEALGHAGVAAYPPRPDPTLHAAFSRRYVALLRSVVANPVAA
jgi:glycosyltransferase involved in cell wall biosynthesis